MSDMVEKVARAMWADRDAGLASIDAAYGSGGAVRRPRFEDESEIWRSQARAAIAAMREPTKEMVEAGQDTGHDYGPGEQVVHHSDAVWQAMIDEALK